MATRRGEQWRGARRGTRSRWLGPALVVGDGVCLALAFAFTALLAGWVPRGELGVGSLDRIVVLCAAGLWLIRRKQLHKSSRSSIVSLEVAALLQVGVWLVGASVVLDQVVGTPARWQRPIFGALLSVLLLVAWRSLYRSRLRAWRLDGRYTRPVMIVGVSDETVRLHRLLADHADAGFRSLGVVGDREDAKYLGLGGEWAGPFDEAISAIEAGVSTGVVLVANALRPDEMTAIARRVHGVGGHVHVSSGLAGVDHRRFTTQPIAHEPLLYLEPPQIAASRAFGKRVIDIACAVVGLVVTAPVLLVAAIATKLNDGGPVLFRQERVGRDGTPFTMLKMRTMVVNAEEVLADYADQNLREGPLFKLEHDPRITRIGRILRATDLDEIPQLINVLRGEMSMVGPRPALPSEVAQFDDNLRRRAAVRPGLTGLWQVEARDNPSFSAYERLDLFYVDNWSVTLDLIIMLLTVESKVVQQLARRGGSADVGSPVPSVSEAGASVTVETAEGTRLALPID